MSRVIGEWTEHGNYPIVQVVGLKVIAPATALRMNIHPNIHWCYTRRGHQ